jgi:hypothetical protein
MGGDPAMAITAHLVLKTIKPPTGTNLCLPLASRRI